MSKKAVQIEQVGHLLDLVGLVSPPHSEWPWMEGDGWSLSPTNWGGNEGAFRLTIKDVSHESFDKAGTLWDADDIEAAIAAARSLNLQ